MSQQPIPAPTVAVWDVESNGVREVSPSEAVAGLLRYAKSLGPGTPAAAAATQQALRLAREHGLQIGAQR